MQADFAEMVWTWYSLVRQSCSHLIPNTQELMCDLHNQELLIEIWAQNESAHHGATACLLQFLTPPQHAAIPARELVLALMEIGVAASVASNNMAVRTYVLHIVSVIVDTLSLQ